MNKKRAASHRLILRCGLAVLVTATASLTSRPVAADDLDLGVADAPPSTKPARHKPQKRKLQRQVPQRKQNNRAGQFTPRANTTNLTGVWQTTDGWTVRLVQQGARASGTYTGTGLSGTLSGTVQGNAFNGTFSHQQGAIAFRGKMYLAYSASQNKLQGRWSAGSYSEPIIAVRLSR